MALIKSTKPYQRGEGNKPQRVTDLVGERVVARIANRNPLLEDEEINCTLDYVERGWIGLSYVHKGHNRFVHVPRERVIIKNYVRMHWMHQKNREHDTDTMSKKDQARLKVAQRLGIEVGADDDLTDLDLIEFEDLEDEDI